MPLMPALVRVYRESSRTSRTVIQRDPILKNKMHARRSGTHAWSQLLGSRGGGTVLGQKFEAGNQSILRPPSHAFASTFIASYPSGCILQTQKYEFRHMHCATLFCLLRPGRSKYRWLAQNWRQSSSLCLQGRCTTVHYHKIRNNLNVHQQSTC